MKQSQIIVLSVAGVILLIALVIVGKPVYEYAEAKRIQMREPPTNKPGQKKFPLLVGAALVLVALPTWWVNRSLQREKESAT